MSSVVDPGFFQKGAGGMPSVNITKDIGVMYSNTFAILDACCRLDYRTHRDLW